MKTIVLYIVAAVIIFAEYDSMYKTKELTYFDNKYLCYRIGEYHDWFDDNIYLGISFAKPTIMKVGSSFCLAAAPMGNPSIEEIWYGYAISTNKKIIAITLMTNTTFNVNLQKLTFMGIKSDVEYNKMLKRNKYEWIGDYSFVTYFYSDGKIYSGKLITNSVYKYKNNQYNIISNNRIIFYTNGCIREISIIYTLSNVQSTSNIYYNEDGSKK